MKNLNLLFNKTFYENLDGSGCGDVKSILKDITSTRFEEEDYKKSEVSNEKFLLRTTYPGLLIGTGNPHGVHDEVSDIAVGFSFDYVTGQPYIPGSSVKGVLRSHFRQYPEIVMEILNGEGKQIDDVRQIKALEQEIFDGSDVFLDAVICEGGAGGLILGEDYITPHKDGPTKNPIPIHILKVLPGVKFEFRFRLTDGELLTAADKRVLFEELITLFGAGAKTNVGYGVFERDNGSAQ